MRAMCHSAGLIDCNGDMQPHSIITSKTRLWIPWLYVFARNE